MPQYEVRIARKDEIKSVMVLLVQERSRFPAFARLMRNPWKRALYLRWVTPRYLRSSANTFVLLQDGRLAGYAVAEQSGGIGQVSSAVGSLDTMTQQNAALVEQSASAAEQLSQQARTLSDAVARFRSQA